MSDPTPEDPAAGPPDVPPAGAAAGAAAVPAPAAVPAAEARIAEELTDGDWHRLHPATPVLRGGVLFIVAIGFLVSSLREQLVEQFVPGQRQDGEQDLIPMLVESGSLIWVILALLAFTLLAVGISYLSWRMHTFRVTEETVEVRSGILSRTNRRARLDRIQGVNIVRPLIARLIGAAKLEIQVAGNDANLPLQYLRSRDADAFRLRVLRLASGARAEAAGAAPASAPAGAPRGFVGSRVDDFLAPELDPDAAPPQSVVRIPIPRLVGAVLLSAPTVVLVLFVAVGIPLIVRFEAWYLLVPLLPTLLGSAGFFVRRITRSLRYSVAGTPDGVRVGFGLLSTSNDTIPPGRIHAVEVVQPLLWRASGWWEIRITRASHSSSPGAAGQQNTSILPVGDRRDVDRVLGLVLPDLVGDQALALVAVGMTGRGGVDDGFTTSPRRAWILKPFSWRRTGFAVDASAFLVRRGVIWRRLVIVPHARTQGVDLTQGPIDRRLDLVSVRAATVAGPVDTRLGAIDRATGMELSTRLVAALRPRRHLRRRHRMAAPGRRRRRRPPPSLRPRGPRMTAPSQRSGRLGVGIVGAGRVGPVLGAALAGAGHAITGISAVSAASRERAEAMLPGVPVLEIPDLIERSELVILAVPDAELPGLVAGLAATGAWQAGQLVVHTSAAHGIQVLAPAFASGIIPLAIHPAMSFTGTSMDLSRMVDSWFAVTAPAPVLPIAQVLVVEMGGEPVVVEERDRAAYAEAISTATTFSTAIVDQAAGLLAGIGVEEPGRVLGPLIRSAVDDALRRSSPAGGARLTTGDVPLPTDEGPDAH